MANNTSSNNTYHGLGFLTILQLIFIVLKVAGVTNVATWSWFQVFIPTMIEVAIYLVIFIVIISSQR